MKSKLKLETRNKKQETPSLCLRRSFSLPLVHWYQIHRRDLPWRRTKDPYAILVSEIMLQQTQVKTVLPYYSRWMSLFPDSATLAAASEQEVLKAWEGLGYYRRARLLHQAAQQILTLHKGCFPNTAEKIAELPGVGPYTLGAVASIAFDLPQPILDGNVIRVLSRWFGIRTPVNESKTRKKLWLLAKELIPEKKSVGDFNQSLMELGALVCTPQKPACSICPIKKRCWAFLNHAQAKIPKIVSRPETMKQFEYAGLAIRDRHVLLLQRGANQRMEGLWQFPSVILQKPSSKWSQKWKVAFGSYQDTKKLGSLNYSVTYHRIHLEFVKVIGLKLSDQTSAQWIDLTKAIQLPFTAAHRKLVDQFFPRPLKD